MGNFVKNLLKGINPAIITPESLLFVKLPTMFSSASPSSFVYKSPPRRITAYQGSSTILSLEWLQLKRPTSKK